MLVVCLAFALIAAGCGDSDDEASATSDIPAATDAGNSEDPTDTTVPAGTTAPSDDTTDSTEVTDTTGAADTTISPPSTDAVPATTTPSDDCGSGGPLSDEGLLDGTFTMANGDERTYQIDTPPGYEEGTEAAFVFNFHGRGSTSFEQYLYGNFIDLAAADTVFLVMPQAVERGDAVQWRAGLPGEGLDLDFVDELLAELRSQYCVGKVFATGMSSGGGMTSALACWANSPFEAYGPVTLAIHEEALCENAPARPIVYFHGTDDDTVPFDGNGNFLDAAPVTAQEWAEHNGCDGEGDEERVSDEVLRYTWEGCDASTEFYVVEGGGHTWPGAIDVPGLGYVTDDISASQIIWDLFFAQSTS